MNGPVRVLHLADHLALGGAERWLWDIVRSSDSSRIRSKVIALMLDRGDFVFADRLASIGAYRHSMFRPLLKRLNSATGETQAQDVAHKPRRWVASVWHAGCYVRASVTFPAALLAFRPHVIHAHGYELRNALRLRRIFRVPIVHTVPALFSQMDEVGFSSMRELYRTRHRDVALFFSGASRADLRASGIPDEKVRWIEGVIDVAAVRAAVAERDRHREAVRKEIGAPGNAPIALSVGRFHPSKGHRFAIEALAKMRTTQPDIHWIVLGVGQDMEPLRALARDLGVADRAHFLGFRTDPLPYYAAVDIYMRTTTHEAENLCSYQAMAAGLPVVGFDTGAETELIPTVGHGALVRNGDADALAARAADILGCPDRGRHLGELGAAYANAHLDYRRTLEAYYDAYTGLAS